MLVPHTLQFFCCLLETLKISELIFCCSLNYFAHIEDFFDQFFLCACSFISTTLFTVMCTYCFNQFAFFLCILVLCHYKQNRCILERIVAFNFLLFDWQNATITASLILHDDVWLLLAISSIIICSLNQYLKLATLYCYRYVIASLQDCFQLVLLSTYWFFLLDVHTWFLSFMSFCQFECVYIDRHIRQINKKQKWKKIH